MSIGSIAFGSTGYDFTLVPPAAPRGTSAGPAQAQAAPARAEAHASSVGSQAWRADGAAPLGPTAWPGAVTPPDQAHPGSQGARGWQERPQEEGAPAKECACGQAPCVCGGQPHLNNNRPAGAREGFAGSAQRELSQEEMNLVRQLQARDREVRAHEQAHIAAGGGYVRGGATFSYRTGPDGRQYAVGGEVSIDASKAATPEETLAKAQAIRRAALAPAKPSAQDKRVAAQAAAMETEARAQMAREQEELGASAVRGSLAGAMSPPATYGPQGRVPAAGAGSISLMI